MSVCFNMYVCVCVVCPYGHSFTTYILQEWLTVALCFLPLILVVTLFTDDLYDFSVHASCLLVLSW